MSRHRQLSVECRDRPRALQRVVAVCEGRRCPIVALDWRAGDRHRPAHLVITVTGDERQTARLRHWLEALVEVRRVVELAPEPVCGPGPEPVAA
jgi:acetolactate synthase small subunit